MAWLLMHAYNRQSWQNVLVHRNSSIDRGRFYVTKVVAQASRVTCIDKRANREQTAHKSLVKEF